jgi:predicted phosphodiesterase
MTHIIEGWDLGVERIIKHYLGEVPDIVVCGDTHFEFVRRENGILIINAGSATYPHNLEARLGHVAILEVERGKPPDAWIVDLSTLTGKTVAD